jgi:hypothetical protein
LSTGDKLDGNKEVKKALQDNTDYPRQDLGQGQKQSSKKTSAHQ